MLPALIPVLANIIDRVIPDPQAAADAKMKALEMAQKGELAVLQAETDIAKGQIEINKTEAATDVFRGGWRPACGWTCAAGLFYNFIVQPLLPWFVIAAGGHVPPLPNIDNETLLALLLGMLGLGSLRTYERVRGKA